VLRFSEVSTGTGGGVRCERCNAATGATTYVDASTLAGRIARAVASAAVPGPNVALTGPEPFDHPELPAVVAAAVRAGVVRLRLDTDAGALSVPSNAAGAISAGVRHLRVTLLGGSPGTHDVLRGVPGTYEAALAGIRTYVRCAEEQDTPVSVTVLVPVCRHNVREVPAAVAAAAEAGAASVLLRVEDGGADLDAALPWIFAACDTGVVNGTWVEVEGVPFCMAAGAALHLADTHRERDGAHGPRCATCTLSMLCGGGPAGASADVLASLAPPEGVDALAACVSRARGADA
jgi:hypothetical protein